MRTKNRQHSGTMEERAVRALRATWQTIGYDYIAAMASVDMDRLNRSERAMSRVSLKGDDVQEAVSACGFVGGYPEDYGNDEEAVRWLDRQPSEVQDAILETAFPSSHKYGL